jgi:hypothetical protein
MPSLITRGRPFAGVCICLCANLCSEFVWSATNGLSAVEALEIFARNHFLFFGFSVIGSVLAAF